MLCLTRGRKPTVMEAIGMLVMPEFFTYRSLKRMTGGCKDVAILRGSALPGALLKQQLPYMHSLDSFSSRQLGGVPDGGVNMRGACRWC